MAKVFDMGKGIIDLPDWKKLFISNSKWDEWGYPRSKVSSDGNTGDIEIYTGNAFGSQLPVLKQEPSFISTPCPCVFVYSDYKTIDVALKKIYPNTERDFWAGSKEFQIGLYSKEWRFDPDLQYPNSYKHKNSHLFIKKSVDEMVVFRTGRFNSEAFDNFGGYLEREFNLFFWPCPPEEAMEVGQKAGLFLSSEEQKRKEIEDSIEKEPDPTIRRMKRIVLSFKEE
jgi:hypothetical protein